MMLTQMHILFRRQDVATSVVVQVITHGLLLSFPCRITAAATLAPLRAWSFRCNTFAAILSGLSAGRIFSTVSRRASADNVLNGKRKDLPAPLAAILSALT